MDIEIFDVGIYREITDSSNVYQWNIRTITDHAIVFEDLNSTYKGIDPITGVEVWKNEYHKDGKSSRFMSGHPYTPEKIGDDQFYVFISSIPGSQDMFEKSYLNLETGIIDASKTEIVNYSESLEVSTDGYLIDGHKWIDPVTYEVLGGNLSTDEREFASIYDIRDGLLYFFEDIDIYGDSYYKKLVCKRISQ